jgi:hypothetical protein
MATTRTVLKTVARKTPSGAALGAAEDKLKSVSGALAKIKAATKAMKQKKSVLKKRGQ